MENLKVTFSQEENSYETAVMELQYHNKSRSVAVGIISDYTEDTHIIPPHVIKMWVENGIQVYLQRNYGSKAQYSNMDYAEIGAEIIDTAESVIKICQVIVKHSSLLEKEYTLISKSKIIISDLDLSQITSEWAHFSTQEHLTFFGINLLQSAADNWAFKNYFFTDKEGNTHIDYNAVVTSMVRIISQTSSIRSAVQTSPILLQTIYCLMGQICNQEVADVAGVPWKDIAGLCWEWN